MDSRTGALDALILDFGGTIAVEVDPAGLLDARRRAAGELLGRRGRGRAFASAWAEVCRRIDRPSGECGHFGPGDAAALLGGRDADPALVDALTSALIEPPGHPQRLRLVPGALTLLSWARARSLACAVLSNTAFVPGWLNRRWLAEQGVLERLAPGGAIFSDEVGVRKPHRRAFEACLRVIGAPVRRCAFVGDDPVCDVEGARRIGMVAVWVTEHASGAGTPPPADIVVPRLSAVPPALTEAGLVPAG